MLQNTSESLQVFSRKKRFTIVIEYNHGNLLYKEIDLALIFNNKIKLSLGVVECFVTWNMDSNLVGVAIDAWDFQHKLQSMLQNTGEFSHF